MCNYSGTSPNSIQTSIIKHVEYTLFKNRFSFNNTHCYQAAAHSIRDRLIESFNDT
jgi:starch phosphorylase